MTQRSGMHDPLPPRCDARLVLVGYLVTAYKTCFFYTSFLPATRASSFTNIAIANKLFTDSRRRKGTLNSRRIRVIPKRTLNSAIASILIKVIMRSVRSSVEIQLLTDSAESRRQLKVLSEGSKIFDELSSNAIL